MTLITYQNNADNKVGTVIAQRFYVNTCGDIICYDENNDEFAVIKNSAIYRAAETFEEKCSHDPCFH